MSDPAIRAVKRAIEDARAQVLQAGMPRATVDCVHLERLILMAEHATTPTDYDEGFEEGYQAGYTQQLIEREEDDRARERDTSDGKGRQG